MDRVEFETVTVGRRGRDISLRHRVSSSGRHHGQQCACVCQGLWNTRGKHQRNQHEKRTCPGQVLTPPSETRAQGAAPRACGLHAATEPLDRPEDLWVFLHRLQETLSSRASGTFVRTNRVKGYRMALASRQKIAGGGLGLGL